MYNLPTSIVADPFIFRLLRLTKYNNEYFRRNSRNRVKVFVYWPWAANKNRKNIEIENFINVNRRDSSVMLNYSSLNPFEAICDDLVIICFNLLRWNPILKCLQIDF